MSCFLVDALGYAARGWSIIPIRHRSAKGKEPACRSWKPFQRERADEGTLRRWFAREGLHGLAVVCGEVSAGTVCRDFDQLASYQHWAATWPELAGTLPTVSTARGRHVYFNGSRRHIVHVGDGELRGAGYCLLPPSVHPTGHVYGWTVPLPDGPLPAIEPESVGLAPAVTERAESVERTERIKAMVEGDGELTVEQAIVASLPNGPGERNNLEFVLARALKAVPNIADADPQELKLYVKRWHALAVPTMGTKPFDETWFDFLYGWKKVKFPLGEEPMAQILKRAKDSVYPKAAERYELPALRLLVALCRELQRAAGDAPFYLSCRTAERLLGVNHMKAWKWLAGLTNDGVLREVEKGGQAGTARRATRYRYVADS